MEKYLVLYTCLFSTVPQAGLLRGLVIRSGRRQILFAMRLFVYFLHAIYPPLRQTGSLVKAPIQQVNLARVSAS